MKIILTAFGDKLWSGPMDVPENTSTHFDMVLASPATTITGYSGKKIDERGPMQTRCRFEWNGKVTVEGARIYFLTEITKEP